MKLKFIIPISSEDPDHVTNLYQSERWKAKVSNNVEINDNDRNVMFSLSIDGFNPFSTKECSLWPIVLTVGRSIQFLNFLV
jgi:hypothetical protein